ncbi:DNA-binding response regulator, OmpR family, contains REC and winged-helix (wHTH) domain [Anaerocolumna jejuensis DSM 15929]|uniref:Stage 0 sporulation protein A homolog n=1 Tax=Anaerocolumna jejuensis DSM 15929 TaxID=1121322 RepID=A0A1M6M0G2_9FIRM|nr:response regulator transcription factor [Anaerocolumna jejuensis]SHJ76961.1 DNA-binding response regulator, OmpR family, contains REC and winged-helix (wHTH) domain [Anaerocolumna jejuensis DSM 15929]
MARILIIEDDKKLNDGIRLALLNEKYEIMQSRTLEQARAVMKAVTLDLIVLDLNLPDGNGLDFLTKLRQASSMPVIILTANNLETDIVTGLELGADDYITKPFSLMVLRARVSVQLRKSGAEAEEQMIIDEFQFDFHKMQFLVRGEAVELSKTEQRLLRILLNNKGATVSRSALIDKVWNGDTEYVDEHALTVSVKRLRDKLGENPSNPSYIKNVYGIGYTWAVK